MAYSYYPYQPNYFAPQYQQPQQTQQPVQSGFVRVQSENEARMYPVAPGNSITFIDENGPYCYVKTMDISQLDRPKFEKYRLVKEEESQAVAKNATVAAYATKAEVDALRETLTTLEDKFSALTKKREADDE